MRDKNPAPQAKPGAPAVSVPSSLGKIIKESGKPINQRAAKGGRRAHSPSSTSTEAVRDLVEILRSGLNDGADLPAALDRAEDTLTALLEDRDRLQADLDVETDKNQRYRERNDALATALAEKQARWEADCGHLERAEAERDAFYENRNLWRKRVIAAEAKLAKVRKLNDKYSLYGSIPCDDVDAIFDAPEGGES